ncbi:hypothetical protein ALO71_101657 [Pseudomonas amygdali pv. dendropanacis]|uniref:Uncharacterized protein n=4 Tax=Pseudomonas syringae group genomosp. 2 TaxID=251698 RepID=A0A0P9WL63_PSEA0|nr:hypothetical protein AC519_5180 [Pseudomonas savastanoi]KPB60683.1 Uncharacterized protein AC510_3218 [Pseudomonas amygdali pv. myricae]KPC57368.1 Uncharacterized protein AC509_5577 [Pseudomonas amygdali pv. morsprunorum]KPW74021.1 Uncharacterized protein ALO78_04893 [Pseudomonas amygdali pv. ciccaronei]KPX10640.1 hypothetical protein ALO74_101693 [Pseudomonas syringae pv. cunninghamiae]KPX13372.1 hypothetical protein ALO71_101657 [Pseudomonas amygdali pv. dendropanacis]KPY06130.1 hypothet
MTVSVFQESIGRQGEIRDRTTEGQHYRIADLHLLAAVINGTSRSCGHRAAK